MGVAPNDSDQSRGKGSATITITATTRTGLSATQQFKVRVRKPNGSDSNRPPRAVGGIVDQNLETGDSRSMVASPTSRTRRRRPHLHRREFGRRSGLRCRVGRHRHGAERGPWHVTVTITARDPDGLTASLEFDVTVSEPPEENRPPRVVGKILSQELEEGDSRAIRVSPTFGPRWGRPHLLGREFGQERGKGVDIRRHGHHPKRSPRDSDHDDHRPRRQLAAFLKFDVTVSEPTEENRAPTAVGTIPSKALEEDNSITIDASPFCGPRRRRPHLHRREFGRRSGLVAVSGDTVTVRSEGLGTVTVTITAATPTA